MTVPDLLTDLRSRGFTLSLKGGGAGRLTLSPASKMSEADRQAVALHRDALLCLLGVELSGPVELLWPDGTTTPAAGHEESAARPTHCRSIRGEEWIPIPPVLNRQSST